MSYSQSKDGMFPSPNGGAQTWENHTPASNDDQWEMGYPQSYQGYPQSNQGHPATYGPQNPTMQGFDPATYGNGMAQFQSDPPPNSGKWNARLCGCGGDCVTCCLGCWCPFILIGQNIEIIDRGATSCTTAAAIWAIVQYLTGCGFAYSFMYRRRFREKYGLPSRCPDIVIDCCCGCCSACQIDKEFKSRNIDPSLGFERVRHIYDQPAGPSAPPQQQMMY